MANFFFSAAEYVFFLAGISPFRSRNNPGIFSEKIIPHRYKKVVRDICDNLPTPYGKLFSYGSQKVSPKIIP
jgi:hypothetical protein